MKIFKSISAIIIGIVVGALLSVLTDFFMDTAGVIDADNFKQTPVAILCVIIAYRFLFNVIGSYITASIAPQKPMAHSIVLGLIGLGVSIAGFFLMADEATLFYNLGITLISFPSAWVGGKLYIRKKV